MDSSQPGSSPLEDLAARATLKASLAFTYGRSSHSLSVFSFSALSRVLVLCSGLSTGPQVLPWRMSCLRPAPATSWRAQVDQGVLVNSLEFATPFPAAWGRSCPALPNSWQTGFQFEGTALLSLASSACRALDYDPAPDPPECGREPPLADSSTDTATWGRWGGHYIIEPCPGHTTAKPRSNQQGPDHLSVHPQTH